MNLIYLATDAAQGATKLQFQCRSSMPSGLGIGSVLVPGVMFGTKVSGIRFTGSQYGDPAVAVVETTVETATDQEYLAGTEFTVG